MEESRKTFVHKVYTILENNLNRDIIRWNDLGNAFLVCHTDIFSQKILPLYFKHANFSSFIRQLNLYGFKKVKNNEKITFMHDRFLRDRMDLLDTIKRKTPEFDLKPEDKKDTRIVELYDQLQDCKHQMKEIREDLFKEKERRHHIRVKYDELMLFCKANNYMRNTCSCSSK